MSEATRIVAVRHGETAWNAVSRMQGHQDIALNDVGRAQARSVATALRDEGIHAIYASDLQRAFETAQAIDFFGECAGISWSPCGSRLSVAVADATYSSLLQFDRV